MGKGRHAQSGCVGRGQRSSSSSGEAGHAGRNARHLFKVEDNVQLAHAAKVFVEQLDVAVDHLQRQQLVVCFVDGKDEEQARVPAGKGLRSMRAPSRAPGGHTRDTIPPQARTACK